MSRQASVSRQTNETSIQLELDLDGAGQSQIATGVGFFDHMLNLLARHALFDLTIEAKGDLEVDAHHTVEDVGLAFGMAVDQALADRRGIVRYGSITLPMDEALVTTAVDLGGRPYFAWNVPIPATRLGTFETELAEEFWKAAASSARMNFHAVLHHGRNTHHIIEAVFKSAARSLRQAVAIDPRAANDVPSTKGVL